MRTVLPHRTLIMGGARSGKSEFAERLVESFDSPKTFIATSEISDSEMRCRIEEHRRRRGMEWRTVEAPLDIASALDDLGDEGVAVLDCLTIWLSNLMLSEGETREGVDRLMLALERCRGSVVTVSNEVGQGIVPENPLARRFRDEHGRLNQRFAASCDLVVLVTAGLPLVLKGALPGSPA
ncbi:MAG: bifunctional adenosylcobinamide kinase/adenosylcobinamide-phosphate guanylyltransferase [Rhodobacter sp.]|nr:bifunctional adenosylcobinamide kinase/adenosylcobinamide-phosphate guanylyltransferase [Rhodobacter sp.]